MTAALDAGVSLPDVDDAAGHADPRTIRRYDRDRHSLDRAATYAAAAFIATRSADPAITESAHSELGHALIVSGVGLHGFTEDTTTKASTISITVANRTS